MKIKKSVWIRGYHDRRQVERDLVSAGVDPDSGEWNFALDIHGWSGQFDVDDARWVRLRDIAIRNGINPLIGEIAEYSETEIATAELLELHFTVDSRGDTGPENGNEYDYSRACPLCLSGAKLIPPFRIGARELPKKRSVAVTHAGELLVTGDTSLALAAMENSDRWLVAVVDERRRSPLAWRAIQPSLELPRWHSSTTGMKHQTGLGPPWDTCPKCGRDCHGPKIGEAVQIVYSRAALTTAAEHWPDPGMALPDVARTWELMGPGTRQVPNARRQVAQPYIIVSQPVARILRHHAAKWVSVSPVSLLA